MYSPAAAPCIVAHRAGEEAEAVGDRRDLVIQHAGSRGLPQFSASRAAKASASRSIASASFSSRAERSAGVVADQVAKAFSAALTAASTC